MRQLFALLICSILAVGNLAAQVSIAGASPVTEATFDNTVKTENIALEHDREKQLRAERRKIRHERNTIEFNAGLSGSLSNFNSKWQSVNGNTNSITAIANILFTHNFKKGHFTIDNKLTAKLGATSKSSEWIKSQDEWFISTAPAYKISDNWNFGAILSLRSQFANGVNGDGNRTSSLFAPAYFNVSLGFTYVCPNKKFPVKINLSPISLNATYVTSDTILNHFFTDKFGKNRADYLADNTQLTNAQKITAYCYGLTPNDGTSRYEGGLSIQIDFDRTFGKKGIFRYRTTLYSFYGWINEISQQTGKNKEMGYANLAPNIRWEHTVDIKATKYFSTQFYFQMYYNKAQCNALQTQIVLGVGLSYTFKNK